MYIFIGVGFNQNCLVCWWVMGVIMFIWEYMLFRLGWWVQVVNEMMLSGQVKMYEYFGSVWIELVGGMVDVLSDGKLYVCENGVWVELGLVVKLVFNVLLFMNLMFDMGCFVGIVVNLLSMMFIMLWILSIFINGWNGVSFVDGGKFVFDNSINGGVGLVFNVWV